MKFGSRPVERAEGAILAHGVRLVDGRLLRKGTRLAAADLHAVAASGIEEVVVAEPEEGDVGEDEAARLVARAVAGPGVEVEAPAAGRANLLAGIDGVFRPRGEVVERVNAVHESVQLATLAADRVVRSGEVVASVKVVPFAVPGDVLERILSASASSVAVHGFTRRSVHLILTRSGDIPERALEVARRRTGARVSRLGGRLSVSTVDHEVEALAAALTDAAGEAEVVLVFGASATADRADIVPAALERAGGRVLRLGIPVDPGNLLLLGEREGVPVVGVPGCARSPRPSGFDRVLARVMADTPPTPEELARMGVGGLLRDIGSRPSPRQARRRAGPAVGVVLAAGRSLRAGPVNKLLLTLHGEPLVRRAVRTALEGLDRVVVVTGHEAQRVRAALDGLNVAFVHNEAYAEGMAGSLAAGVAAARAAEPELRALAVVLGDMPYVRADTLRRLVEALDADPEARISLPVHEGRRGHPVLWDARLLSELMDLTGDVGARAVLARYRDEVVEVQVDDPGVVRDVDTPADLSTPCPD